MRIEILKEYVPRTLLESERNGATLVSKRSVLPRTFTRFHELLLKSARYRPLGNVL